MRKPFVPLTAFIVQTNRALEQRDLKKVVTAAITLIAWALVSLLMVQWFGPQMQGPALASLTAACAYFAISRVRRARD